jgi:hypothetical protein
MLVLVGLLLAVMSAGAVALHILGLAALVERRWRSAALELGGGVVASMVVFVALALAARLLMRGDLGVEGVPVEMKARALGDNISALMSVTALGIPAGLIAGALLVWRRRMRAKVKPVQS